MLMLITGLALFFGTHSVAVVCPAWRERMIGRLGLKGWKALFSLVALAGFVLIVVGYGNARLEPVVLYSPPAWLRHVAFLLLLPVFPLVLAAYLPGRIQTTARHPLLAATKIWALAHLLVNGTLADVLLFGGFLVWAVVDRISVKRRPARPVPGAPPGKWNDAIVVAGGLALYSLFLFWGHAWLIGVPLMPV